jgi:hypothetical protein
MAELVAAGFTPTVQNRACAEAVSAAATAQGVAADVFVKVQHPHAGRTIALPQWCPTPCRESPVVGRTQPV